ncbi:MAG: HAMP domain-containing sensor histidine kinase [Pseudomonadota bacterium]
MNRQQSLLAARGLTDASDRLLSADEPLAELHHACGGTLPGTLAVPELLDLVRQSRQMGLRIAREFSAFDGEELVSGFARIHPLDEKEGDGCEVLVENWQRAPQTPASSHDMAERADAIDRASAEVTARLDARQIVQFVTATAPDASELLEKIEAAPGRAWSEYVTLAGIAHRQPLHWRLLDGASAQLPGSQRSWRLRLFPVGASGSAPRAFELLFIADQPFLEPSEPEEDTEETAQSRVIGSALTPVLRQPIARIIANAETIRARLAGPLRDDYSDYAGNIAAAGQHLAGMLDDLSDLEVVEAPGFSTAQERVDLADVARRAAGILGVRAQSKGITLLLGNAEEPEGNVLATAEFRRVLQILINLIGNAINYSPENSAVTITAKAGGNSGPVSVSVIDQGPGISREQAVKIFDKFERLGRDKDGNPDGGSGLGLYISRKLALAMKGELEVLPAEEGGSVSGAEFRLSLPQASD